MRQHDDGREQPDYEPWEWWPGTDPVDSLHGKLVSEMTGDEIRAMAGYVSDRPPLGINPCCEHCDHEPGLRHADPCLTCAYDMPDYDRQ